MHLRSLSVLALAACTGDPAPIAGLAPIPLAPLTPAVDCDAAAVVTALPDPPSGPIADVQTAAALGRWPAHGPLHPHPAPTHRDLRGLCLGEGGAVPRRGPRRGRPVGRRDGADRGLGCHPERRPPRRAGLSAGVAGHRGEDPRRPPAAARSPAGSTTVRSATTGPLAPATTPCDGGGRGSAAVSAAADRRRSGGVVRDAEAACGPCPSLTWPRWTPSAQRGDGRGPAGSFSGPTGGWPAAPTPWRTGWSSWRPTTTPSIRCFPRAGSCGSSRSRPSPDLRIGPR